MEAALSADSRLGELAKPGRCTLSPHRLGHTRAAHMNHPPHIYDCRRHPASTMVPCSTLSCWHQQVHCMQHTGPQHTLCAAAVHVA